MGVFYPINGARATKNPPTKNRRIPRCLGGATGIRTPDLLNAISPHDFSRNLIESCEVAYSRKSGLLYFISPRLIL